MPPELQQDDDEQVPIDELIRRVSSGSAQPDSATAAPMRRVVDMTEFQRKPSVIGIPPPTPMTERPLQSYRRMIEMEPKPSQLQAMYPAPQPPPPDPRRATTLDTIQRSSIPTAKRDAQGNIAKEYRPGIGSRIARAATAFLVGGVPGVVASGVNPNSNLSWGRGAVNQKYYDAERARQGMLTGAQEQQKALDSEANLQEKDYQHQLTGYNDDVRRAAATDTNALKEENQARLREKDATIADLKQKAEDFKEQNRDITFDQKSGQFMRGGRSYIPQKVEEGMLLETAYGVKDGPWTQRWNQERRNQPISIHTGGNLSGREQLKIRAYMRANGIKDKEDLTPDQIDEALSNQPAGGNWGSTAENRDFKQRTATIDREIAAAEKEAADAQAGIDASATPSPASQRMLAAANKRIQDAQAKKESIKQEIIQNRPANKGKQPAKTTPTSGTIRVQKTDGSTGTIPAANRDKAIAKGWKIL